MTARWCESAPAPPCPRPAQRARAWASGKEGGWRERAPRTSARAQRAQRARAPRTCSLTRSPDSARTLDLKSTPTVEINWLENLSSVLRRRPAAERRTKSVGGRGKRERRQAATLAAAAAAAKHAQAREQARLADGRVAEQQDLQLDVKRRCGGRRRTRHSEKEGGGVDIDRRREKIDPRQNPAGSKLGARQLFSKECLGLRMRVRFSRRARRVVKFFPSVFAKQLRVRVYTHPLA